MSRPSQNNDSSHSPRNTRAALYLCLATLASLAVTGCTTTEDHDPTLATATDHHPPHEPARLGKVEFETGCNAAAQQRFNVAMALYHSFAWKAASDGFDSVLATERGCGIAHWGRAMTVLDNPFGWPVNLSPAKLDAVAAALNDARATGLKSQREKDYVDALESFVRRRDVLDHRTRLAAFETAMSTLAARYPGDPEAAILSALVISTNFDPKDKNYTNQRKAARILEPLVKAMPDHPGVTHYLIHTYDYPPLAQHGLGAARRYNEIAPDAPHALHMPSHIFTRLGLWRESIAANEASAKAASKATFDAHHAYDYLVYARLQLSQYEAARRAMQQSLAMQPVDNFAAAYAYAAMPARLALERAAWRDAAELELRPPAPYPWNKYPQAEAVNAFARGVGSALSGDAAAARKEEARLIALRGAALAAKLDYWAGQIDIQAALVHALVLCTERKARACVEGLRKTAAREDATEKHVVTPGPLVPARELLAETLLVQGKARAALAAFEAVIAKEPRRYRALAGAMQAARAAGAHKTARKYAQQLIEQTAEADTLPAALDEARRLARP